MEIKLYERIAELLREQNLLSDSEFKRTIRLIQSKFEPNQEYERKNK